MKIIEVTKPQIEVLKTYGKSPLISELFRYSENKGILCKRRPHPMLSESWIELDGSTISLFERKKEMKFLFDDGINQTWNQLKLVDELNKEVVTLILEQVLVFDKLIDKSYISNLVELFYKIFDMRIDVKEEKEEWSDSSNFILTPKNFTHTGVDDCHLLIYSDKNSMVTQNLKCRLADFIIKWKELDVDNKIDFIEKMKVRLSTLEPLYDGGVKGFSLETKNILELSIRGKGLLGFYFRLDKEKRLLTVRCNNFSLKVGIVVPELFKDVARSSAYVSFNLEKTFSLPESDDDVLDLALEIMQEAKKVKVLNQ